MFKKTKERSKELLLWAEDCQRDILKIERELFNLADAENDLALIEIMHDRLKMHRDDMQFFKDGIVEWHLDAEELKIYNKLYPTKVDRTTNYMM